MCYVEALSIMFAVIKFGALFKKSYLLSPPPTLSNTPQVKKTKEISSATLTTSPVNGHQFTHEHDCCIDIESFFKNTRKLIASSKHYFWCQNGCGLGCGLYHVGVLWGVPSCPGFGLATMHSTSELSEVECQRHKTAAATYTEKRKGAGLINHNRDVL